MEGIRVYVDDSAASRQLERELQERGINYTRIPEIPAQRPLPALETARQVIVGLSNVRLYFLNGGE